MNMASAKVTVQLVDDTIDANAVWDLLADEDCGAHSVFLGKTRRTTVAEDAMQITEYLAYEAHRPMASKELERIATEAASRWTLSHLVVIHRLGRVDPGEASVAVGASAAHRRSVMQAVPWVMDELKKSVPIWKQDNDSEGDANWVHS